MLHAFGTASVVVQVTGTNWPKPLYTLLVTGLCRFRIDKIVMEEPYLIAEVTQLDRPSEQGSYIKTLSTLNFLKQYHCNKCVSLNRKLFTNVMLLTLLILAIYRTCVI